VKAQELSRKYATAVFVQALEKWMAALRAVQDKLADKPDLMSKLEDAKLSFVERQRELDRLIPAESDQHIRNFFYTMLREGDINLLGDVINDLERMVQGGPQVQVARVTTAYPLAEEEKEKFRQTLRQKYGGNLEFDFNVDPTIVGGAIIQIGDKVIDGSLKTRLEAMSNLLRVSS
jgi:F-type H+-transporting ATPase subunit delta